MAQIQAMEFMICDFRFAIQDLSTEAIAPAVGVSGCLGLNVKKPPPPFVRTV